MEVVNANAACLSNYEVLSVLRQLRKKDDNQKQLDKSEQNLATIAYEITNYLEKTPCKDQSPEIIQEFLKAVEHFKLSKLEKLMLLNHRPTSAVEIQLMIEDSEERLTDEQAQELLEVIRRVLPGDPEEEDDGNDEEQVEEEMDDDDDA